MPKLIISSRYLKSGSKKRIYHYVKYIATREGAVPIVIKNTNAPASEKQQELIMSLLKDFPDSKDLFEYEDYTMNPNQKTASECISAVMDQNMDRLTNRENYVGYLANRPGAVKLGTHGLFTQTDSPIVLDKVAKEISEHKGNVWTHIVSLRRDHAQQMGYDNLQAWRELIIRQIPYIAKNQKIDLKNLKWYAAFHDKESNPHVHIIVYSTNEKEGFLTKHGIEKIRSRFANDIYYDELHHLYQQQTDIRNLLKNQSQEFVKQLVSHMTDNDFTDSELQDLISKLSEQLQSEKGKKVYGYLQPDVKKTVDEIFASLSENDSIQKLYSLWCEMEQQKHDVYSSAKVSFPRLVDKKEFKSVKNMIIQQVLNMNSITADIDILNESDLPETNNEDEDYIETEIQSENDDSAESIPSDNESIDTAWVNKNEDDIETEIQNNNNEHAENTETTAVYYIKWGRAYKLACKLMYKKDVTAEEIQQAEDILIGESKQGNVLAIHDLGKLYSIEKHGKKDEKKSFELYKEALKGFMEIEPMAKTIIPFETSYPNPEPVDMRAYVWYRIGKFHCYGLGTEQDDLQAFKWFSKSAIAGNMYAQYSLANLYYYEKGIEKDLQLAFSWYMKSAKQGQPYANYAVAGMYAKGEAVSKDEKTAYEFYKKALDGFLAIESKDQADDNLLYKIGTMYKNGLGTDKDIEKAIAYFKQSAELNNKHALYEFGKLMLEGNHIDKDITKALEYLENSIKLENINAKRYLAQEYISGEHIEQDIEKGITMLTELSDSGDALSSYKLGKIYFKGEVTYRDWDKAEKYLLKAAESKSEYAQYTLGKLYLEEEKYNLSKAVYWLEEAVKQDTISNAAGYQLAKILLEDNEYHDRERAVLLLESASKENSWASFLLGRLYLYGTDDITKDKEKAIEWLTLSVEQGNPYAENLLNNMQDYENAMLANTAMSLFVNLSRMIADDYNQKFKSNRMSVDRKLRQKMQQKKQAQGIKNEPSQSYE